MKNRIAFYRNTEDLHLDNGQVVDKGSLWEQVDDFLVLVDDDRYVEHVITSIFKEEN